MISGTSESGTITVAPMSTTVLYLGSTVDSNPVPTAPLYVGATGSPTQVVVDWSAASGAESYSVKRAASPDGAYMTIAMNIPGTTYSDTNVTRGATYYYVVSASNAGGESSAVVKKGLASGAA